MKHSTNYKFNLPTYKDNDLANIGVISQNFETVDRVMKKNEDLGTELNKFEAETMDAVGRLNTKDADLQSQIDNLGGVDLSELQSQIDTANTDIVEIQENVHNLDMELGLTKANLHKVEASMGSWDGSGNLYDMVKAAKTDISALKTKDTDLQSQIDTKVDKVEGKGLSTNDYDDRAKKDVAKIGNTNLIPSDSRYIVNWIQDVYDSVFTSTADNTCLADKVAAEIASRRSGDENLQSQIDALGGVDVSEFQSQLDTLQTNVNGLQMQFGPIYGDMSDWIGSDTVYQAVTKLKAKDTDLQSQINTKATRKVAVVGSDSYDSDGWYKVASGTISRYQAMSLLFAVHTPAKFGKYSGILQLDLRGGAEAIVTGDEIKLGWLVRTGFDLSQVIVTVDGYNWALYYNLRSNQNFRVFFEVIQESGATVDKAIYNLHTDSVVESTTPLATATSTDLGTVNTANKLTTARNINGIAFDGSADINITADDIKDTSGNSLDYKVKSTQTDLNAVKARIGSWGTSNTLYDMIVDLTARIEALENSAS